MSRERIKEGAALSDLRAAYLELRQMGWLGAIHCPEDGSTYLCVEINNLVPHKCTYRGQWPHGEWWTCEEEDSMVAHPILFRVA